VIDELDLTDNTVVIFTSDNGGLLGYATDNRPLRSGKGHPYEGGIRVPAIIRWPGVVEPGTVCDEPITSVDYFPTLLEAAGQAPPVGRVIDGVDLRPLLEGSGTLGRDALYWHFPHYRGRGKNKIMPYSIIRSGDWKLIRRYDGKPFELFNLRVDLREEFDLSDKMPEKVSALDKRLEAWLKSTGAKLPREKHR
jgi:arylsulfatase A-like enzyme